MKSNVIKSSCQVSIQSTAGTLAIIGEAYDRVVIMATGLDFVGQVNIESFAKNAIFTHPVGEFSDTIIFECNLRGELRNPQKLLKSVRNKLMRAINVAHSEFEYEMCQLDHEMSMAEHHPNRYHSFAEESEAQEDDAYHGYDGMKVAGLLSTDNPAADASQIACEQHEEEVND